MGATFDGKRAAVDIADYVRLRLQNHLTALNWTLDLAVNDDAVSGDCSGDVGPARDVEGGAVNFAVNLAVDLDQSLGGDASNNFQSLAITVPRSFDANIDPSYTSVRGGSTPITSRFCAATPSVTNPSRRLAY